MAEWFTRCQNKYDVLALAQETNVNKIKFNLTLVLCFSLNALISTVPSESFG